MKQYSGKKNFPDPLAPQQEKETKDYGLKYAKAIESQWGKRADSSSLFSKRYTLFKRNKDNINIKLPQKEKYYYANQCHEFTEKVTKYGYNPRFKNYHFNHLIHY